MICDIRFHLAAMAGQYGHPQQAGQAVIRLALSCPYSVFISLFRRPLFANPPNTTLPSLSYLNGRG